MIITVISITRSNLTCRRCPPYYCIYIVNMSAWRERLFGRLLNANSHQKMANKLSTIITPKTVLCTFVSAKFNRWMLLRGKVPPFFLVTVYEIIDFYFLSKLIRYVFEPARFIANYIDNTRSANWVRDAKNIRPMIPTSRCIDNAVTQITTISIDFVTREHLRTRFEPFGNPCFVYAIL